MSHWGKPVRVINRDTRLDALVDACAEVERQCCALASDYPDLADAAEEMVASFLVKHVGPAIERSERDDA